jgi:hypothetical protein
MKFFNLFRKKKQEKNKPSDQTIKPPLVPKQTLEKIESEIETCQTQLNTVNIVLQKHDDQLAEHKRRMDQHSEQFEKLEEKVMAEQLPAPTRDILPALRPIDIPSSSTTPAPLTSDSTQKFDINRFSEQQKRILAVFFQNQDMTLSYVDIGRMLNKSPHTVKNQMREIRLKADLFETSIGEQSRRRFKLKNDLRVEKYLNVG